MATAAQIQSDPLLCFRDCLAAQQIPVLTSSNDRADAQPDLALATHVHFTIQDGSTHTFALNQKTRFVVSADSSGINLRGIIWVWQIKAAPISEYLANTANLNERLATSGSSADSKISQISYVERLNLVSWLEGQSDECDYIQPLPHEAISQEATQDARITAGQVSGAAALPSTATAGIATADPRLEQIYKAERSMGDRNTVLRGIKPTVRLIRL
jgi:parafibromin